MTQAHRTDPLRPLRAFTQVARLGSVSRAAEALGISQPAVSLQLQALAREHGVALLQRSGRRLVPTEAGEALLALARPLVEGLDGLGEALRARLAATDGGALGVAAGRVALRRLVPAAAAAWRGAPPAIPLQVRDADAGAALDLLRTGDVALAIGSWLDVPPDIDVAPLLDSPACLVAAPGHPLMAGHPPPTLHDLSRQALAIPADRQTTRRLVDLAFARAGVPMPRLVETRDWETAFDLAALGDAVVLSNQLACGPGGGPRLATRALPGLLPPRPYGIATRRGRPLGAHAARFIALLRETCPGAGT